MEKIKELIKKVCTKETILYLIFGVLTTAVNWGTFWILNEKLKITENTANLIAIIIAVLFAYVTNKIWVFESKTDGFGENVVEFCRFILGRLITMAIEWGGCALLFEYAPIPPMISKGIISVIIIILNFFISKFFAFKKD